MQEKSFVPNNAKNSLLPEKKTAQQFLDQVNYSTQQIGCSLLFVPFSSAWRLGFSSISHPFACDSITAVKVCLRGCCMNNSTVMSPKRQQLGSDSCTKKEAIEQWRCTRVGMPSEGT